MSLPAFQTVYDDCFDFVWSNLRRLGVEEARIDDATQEVFIVVHRRLPDFEGRSSIRTWVFGIARRVASDFRRKSTQSTVELTARIHDEATSPFEATANRQGEVILWSLLNELPAQRREVLVLADLEGLSGPQIAEHLELNVEAVYGRLRQARRQFHEALARRNARIDSTRAIEVLCESSQPTRRDRRRVACLLALSPQITASSFDTSSIVASAEPVGGLLAFGAGSMAKFGLFCAGLGATAASIVFVVDVSNEQAANSARPTPSLIKSASAKLQSSSQTTLPPIDMPETAVLKTKSSAPAEAPQIPEAKPRIVNVTPKKRIKKKSSTSTPTRVGVEPVLVMAKTPQSSRLASRLAEEAALLHDAINALRSGRTTRAQTLVTQHKREFTNGRLTREREGIVIELLCRSNQSEKAHLHAKQYRQRWGDNDVSALLKKCDIPRSFSIQ